MIFLPQKPRHMTDYAGSRDYVGNLYSPWRTPHWSPPPTEKDDPDPLVEDSDPPVTSSVRVFCARNSQREGRSFLREGRDNFFSGRWGSVWGFPRLQIVYVIPGSGVVRHMYHLKVFQPQHANGESCDARTKPFTSLSLCHFSLFLSVHIGILYVYVDVTLEML